MRDFFPCQDHAIAARLRKEYRVTDFAIEDMNANNVTGLLTYGTKEYNVMMLSRTKHILRHLQSGENVIFTDVDTVWRKDPRPFLTGSAIDAWFQKERGEVACAGFFAMRSNKNTISFVKRWMAANSVMEHRQRGRRGIHDQDVLNRLFKRDHSMKRKFLAFPSEFSFSRCYPTSRGWRRWSCILIGWVDTIIRKGRCRSMACGSAIKAILAEVR